MKIENNNYQSGYKTTNTGAASNGMFKDMIAEFMKFGSVPTTSRQTDTFERTSAETKPTSNDTRVITNTELYDALVQEYGSEDTSAIAQELLKNNAVNIENIDPNNCTELELRLLQCDYANKNTGGQMSVLVAFRINVAEIQQRYRAANPDANQKIDWMQVIKDAAQEQIRLGNTRFVEDGTYDELLKYLDALQEHARDSRKESENSN